MNFAENLPKIGNIHFFVVQMTHTKHSLIKTQTATANNTAAPLSDPNKLHCVEIQNGNELWQKLIEQSQPARRSLTVA